MNNVTFWATHQILWCYIVNCVFCLILFLFYFTILKSFTLWGLIYGLKTVTDVNLGKLICVPLLFFES